MACPKDEIIGKWHEVWGQLWQKWGKLTFDETAHRNGKNEELAGVLQQLLGYDNIRAKLEIDAWLSQRDRMLKKV